MSSYNRVILMGNLTRDPEVKFLDSGKAVAKFSLAVNRKYKTADGDKREEVAFIDCEAWGYTAENIGKFFAKGRPILVEGRLRMDKWEARDGSKRSKLLVVVDNFSFVDNKGADAQPEPTAVQEPEPAFADDDLPF